MLSRSNAKNLPAMIAELPVRTDVAVERRAADAQFIAEVRNDGFGLAHRRLGGPNLSFAQGVASPPYPGPGGG